MSSSFGSRTSEVQILSPRLSPHQGFRVLQVSRKTRCVTILSLFCFLLTFPSSTKASFKPVPESIYHQAIETKMPAKGTTAKRAWIICHIWKGGARRCRRILNVAWCESSLRPWASNGQFKGMFEMGADERERYGHGKDAWTQSRSAHTYWLTSHWRPWQCKPVR